MKVSELIERLKTFPGDAEVRIPDMNYCDWTDVDLVTFEPNFPPIASVVHIHSEAM